MRKLSLGVGVLFVFSIVNAEVKVDFDGEQTKKIEITQAASEVEVSIPEIEKLKSKSIKSGVIPKSKISVDTDKKKINQSLDNSIISAIKYCEKQNFNILEKNFRKLLTYGTLEEKYYSIYEHKIPLRISLMKESPENIIDFRHDLSGMMKETKGANPVCLEWSTQEVCIDKEKCDNVCDASTIVCVAFTQSGACAVWGPACHIVCSIIKDCHQWPVCVRWYNDFI